MSALPLHVIVEDAQSLSSGRALPKLQDPAYFQGIEVPHQKTTTSITTVVHQLPHLHIHTHHTQAAHQIKLHKVLVIRPTVSRLSSVAIPESLANLSLTGQAVREVR